MNWHIRSLSALTTAFFIPFYLFLGTQQGFSQSCYLATEDECRGTGALHYLKLPVGARSIALGGKTISTDEGGTTGYSNPANLATVSDYWYSFTHSDILGEFRHEYLSALYPFRDYGTLGVGINVLTSGSIREIDENETDLGTFSQIDLVLGVSYGKYFFNRNISLGSGLELLRSQIADASALGYAFNLGMNYHYKKDYRVSLTAHHLTHGIKYDTRTSGTEDVPQYVTLETGKVPGFGKWSWNAGFTSTGGGDRLYHMGLESKLFKALFLRSGYERSLHDNELDLYSGLSLGAGMIHKGLSVDFGIKLVPPLGNLAALAVSYKHDGEGAFTDKELMARAIEKFKNHDYAGAEKLARMVLAENPSNWNALSLLSKIKKTRERLQGKALSIFYTASTWGNIVPLIQNDKSIGGLSRRQTKIKELKLRYRHSLLLDAGGITAKGKDDENELLMYKMYGKMKYDVVNIGQGELLSRPETIDNSTQKNDITWISSNADHVDWKGSIIPVYNTTTKKGLKILVFGTILPSMLPDSLLQEYIISDIISPVQQELLGSRDSADVTILMLYGSLVMAKSVAQRVPEIDVIILGGSEKMLENPVLNGKTVIVSPGTQGTHLGHLSLSFNEDNTPGNFSNELIPLNKLVKDDQVIESMYSSGNSRIFSGETKLVRQQVYTNQFPFIHRNKKGDSVSIFVKDTKTNFDYNLGNQEQKCSHPKLGVSKEKVVYVCESGDDQRSLHIQRLNSTHSMKISQGDDNIGYFEWGPHFHWIYYTLLEKDRSEVYRMTLTGTQVTQITNGNYGTINNFNLQPGGNKIAIEGNKHGKSQIWIVDMQMETPLRITRETENGYLPKWSGLPYYLAFLVKNPRDQSTYSLDIFDFSKNRRIRVNENIKNINYSWSADGRQIYFSSGINVMDINVFDVETGMQQKICGNHDVIRDEINPIPFYLMGKFGILFESHEQGNNVIRWVEPENKKEVILVDLPGNDFLE